MVGSTGIAEQGIRSKQMSLEHGSGAGNGSRNASMSIYKISIDEKVPMRGKSLCFNKRQNRFHNKYIPNRNRQVDSEYVKCMGMF